MKIYSLIVTIVKQMHLQPFEQLPWAVAETPQRDNTTYLFPHTTEQLYPLTGYDKSDDTSQTIEPLHTAPCGTLMAQLMHTYEGEII